MPHNTPFIQFVNRVINVMIAWIEIADDMILLFLYFTIMESRKFWAQDMN